MRALAWSTYVVKLLGSVSDWPVCRGVAKVNGSKVWGVHVVERRVKQEGRCRRVRFRNEIQCCVCVSHRQRPEVCWLLNHFAVVAESAIAAIEERQRPCLKWLFRMIRIPARAGAGA